MKRKEEYSLPKNSPLCASLALQSQHCPLAILVVAGAVGVSEVVEALAVVGEAFVQSQRHEGWTFLTERYDDGGFTGANMDRPALRKLLGDIRAKKIDCIVVYKVDRLSRSLLDFARIMEILEKENVSFVSVTQAFNSSTSMGRLTLNILLSFAQFEHETIAERTRDKMGAARRKGKWVGGQSFLGYDIIPGGGALAVNEAEAQRVREIFKLYLKLQSVQATAAQLNERGWTMKRWVTQKGRDHGGGRFTKSSLHNLLTNLSYIGKVNYKGHIADAEFPGIVTPEIFDAVRACLRENNQSGGARVRNKHEALLGGILQCGHCGHSMTHSHTTRGKGKVYRYYVCNRAAKEGWDKCPTPSLPAGEIEQFVVDEIVRIGADAALRSEIVQDQERRREREIKEAGATRRKLEQQLASLAKSVRDASAKGDAVALAGGQRQRIEIEGDLASLNAKIAHLTEQAMTEEELRHAMESFLPAWESLAFQERLRLLRLIVQQVSYDGVTGEISITFHANGIKSIEVP